MSTTLSSDRTYLWLLMAPVVLLAGWITSLVLPEVLRSVVIEVVRNVVGR